MIEYHNYPPHRTTKTMKKLKICPRIIRENIINVLSGKPLTLPLATLNQSCKFQKVWKEHFNFAHEEELIKERRALKKIYNQKPEIKEYNRLYSLRYYHAHKNKLKPTDK